MNWGTLSKKVATEQQKKNTTVNLDSLVPNPNQIRSTMETASIQMQVEEIKNVILGGGTVERLEVEPILDQYGEIEYPERFRIIAGHNRNCGLIAARKEALKYNEENPDKPPKHYIEDVEVVILYGLDDKERRLKEYISNRGVRTHILDEARYIMNWADEYGKEECMRMTGISDNKFSELKRLLHDLDPELEKLLIEKEIKTPQTIRNIKKLEPGEKKDWILSEIKAGTFNRKMLNRKAPPKSVEKIDETTGETIVITEVVEEEVKPKKNKNVSVHPKVQAYILKEIKGLTVDPNSDEIANEFRQFVEEVKQKEV